MTGGPAFPWGARSRSLQIPISSLSGRQRERMSRVGFRAVFGRKGGGGVFFAKNASYVVDEVGDGRWLPVCFCALLRHFLRRFGEGCGRAKGKYKDGLAFVVSHPCLKNKGTARMGCSADSTNFRIFSCMVFALRRTNSIVRFWVLIACRVEPVYFARLVVCFVGFRGGAGNWGA